MSGAAIRVHDLSKQYRIGALERARTFRELLNNAFTAPLRALRRDGRKQRPVDKFWALNAVSFEVKPGEVLGIIGRNGAGKSTLLKILSRITEPTRGRVEIKGRIGSLLEVGTGFHPELTGRENIFLNGAILGMRKMDVARRFDEIVAFAEVEKFIDTPVKRYSSGMYLRLAFAVAAHLEPDNLIVDEVLAVGDASFQKKCLGKIGDVSREGRTVLFVSHNMAAVRALCKRVILLERGAVMRDSTDVSEAIASYTELLSVGYRKRRDTRGAGGPIVFREIECAVKGEQPALRLEIRATVESVLPHQGVLLAFDIADASGIVLMQAVPRQDPWLLHSEGPQQCTVEVELPPLVPGTYRVGAWLGPHFTRTYDEVPPTIQFHVDASPDPRRTFPYSAEHGAIVPRSRVVHLADAVAGSRQ